jgi:hypothetical protein
MTASPLQFIGIFLLVTFAGILSISVDYSVGLTIFIESLGKFDG